MKREKIVSRQGTQTNEYCHVMLYVTAIDQRVASFKSKDNFVIKIT